MCLLEGMSTVEGFTTLFLSDRMVFSASRKPEQFFSTEPTELLLRIGKCFSPPASYFSLNGHSPVISLPVCLKLVQEECCNRRLIITSQFGYPFTLTPAKVVCLAAFLSSLRASAQLSGLPHFQHLRREFCRACPAQMCHPR